MCAHEKCAELFTLLSCPGNRRQRFCFSNRLKSRRNFRSQIQFRSFHAAKSRHGGQRYGRPQQQRRAYWAATYRIGCPGNLTTKRSSEPSSLHSITSSARPSSEGNGEPKRAHVIPPLRRSSPHSKVVPSLPQKPASTDFGNRQNKGSRPAMYRRIRHAYLHLSHQLHAEGR